MMQKTIDFRCVFAVGENHQMPIVIYKICRLKKRENSVSYGFLALDLRRFFVRGRCFYGFERVVAEWVLVLP